MKIYRQHKTSVLLLPVLNIPFSAHREEKAAENHWKLTVETVGNGPEERANAVEYEIVDATDGNP